MKYRFFSNKRIDLETYTVHDIGILMFVLKLKDLFISQLMFNRMKRLLFCVIDTYKIVC